MSLTRYGEGRHKQRAASGFPDRLLAVLVVALVVSSAWLVGCQESGAAMELEFLAANNRKRLAELERKLGLLLQAAGVDETGGASAGVEPQLRDAVLDRIAGADDRLTDFVHRFDALETRLLENESKIRETADAGGAAERPVAAKTPTINLNPKMSKQELENFNKLLQRANQEIAKKQMGGLLMYLAALDKERKFSRDVTLGLDKSNSERLNAIESGYKKTVEDIIKRGKEGKLDPPAAKRAIDEAIARARGDMRGVLSAEQEEEYERQGGFIALSPHTKNRAAKK